MGDINSVIEKIKKLRALSRKAGTPAEAEAAAAIADKLLQEYGLAEAQLQASGDKPAETIDEHTFTTFAARAPTWQRILASGLIRHYDCASYLIWLYRSPEGIPFDRPCLSQRIIGRPSDIEAARYMFNWLVVEIERLAQLNAGQGRSWLDSFRRGAVQGVLSKLYESKKAAREEVAAKARVAEAINPDVAKTTSTGLAIYDRRKEEAKAKLYELHPDIKKQEKRSRGGTAWRSASNYDGFRQGREAGGNIHVGASLNSGGSAKALRSK
jgi:Protein of unknown function (DUF2786)